MMVLQATHTNRLISLNKGIFKTDVAKQNKPINGKIMIASKLKGGVVLYEGTFYAKKKYFE